MKGVFRDILIALMMGVAMPSVVLGFGARLTAQGRERSVPAEQTAATQVVEEETIPIKKSGVDMLLRRDDGTLTLDLDEYLVGAVLAEMPADFEPEALKAQAVAARTYARRAFVTGGKHADGSACDNYACCQAYIAPEDYLEKGGSREGYDRVRLAVEATSGLVLSYEGKLIDATYFSCSGGRTEDAVAVWGTDYPYLRSVDSPGEENAAHYRDTVTFLPLEFCARLGLEPEEDVSSLFTEVTYTTGGGVDTMRIGGRVFRGTELRGLLGLRSTAFRVDTQDGMIRITTRGYGHRVGMSQYGADAMAAAGADFGEILAHYYPGTTLEQMESQK